MIYKYSEVSIYIMQKTIDENISIIKDDSTPLKKKIRKYKESIELLETYSKLLDKLGANKLRKTIPEVTIENIDELMNTSQKIVQSFDDGELTIEKMEQLVELKKILLGLQKFIKEKNMNIFVIDQSNIISKAKLEEKILILDNEQTDDI